MISKLILALLVLMPQASVSGLHYKMRMMKPSGTTVFEAWSSSNDAKIQVLETDDRTVRKGFIIVAKDGGEIFQMTTPAGDEYVELTAKRMKELQAQRAAQRGIELLDVKNEKVLEEKGKALIGISCTHFQFRITVKFKEGGVLHDIVATNDIWVAPTIPNPNPKLNLLVNQGSTGIASFDDAMQFGNLGGFPLQRITTMDFDGKRAGQSTFVTEQVEKTALAADALSLPPGLKKKVM